MMRESRFHPIQFALAFLPVLGGACEGAAAAPGHCTPDPNVVCGSIGGDAGGDDGGAATFGGYSCTGSNRPDEIANVNKVVDSLVCHGNGVENSGAVGYCCTSYRTSCAYDPRVVCADMAAAGAVDTSTVSLGYSCMGTNRPDAFDPVLTCQQGIQAYGLIQFCCGSNAAGNCMRNTNISCVAGTTGFTCNGSALPSENDLGQNQSRSQVPLVCSLALATPSTMGGQDYCCYTPTATPPGATCLADHTVSGCEAASFAFACTGVDRPEQDYPRMACSQPGVRRSDAQGSPATVYCCTFRQ
jgi:hypothetical protein